MDAYWVRGERLLLELVVGDLSGFPVLVVSAKELLPGLLRGEVDIERGEDDPAECDIANGICG